MCGVGSRSIMLYSGHSIKRVSIQIYRSLGILDEQIREFTQITGLNAYAAYCAEFNDCALPSLPRFNDIEDFLKHAETLRSESADTNKLHFSFLYDSPKLYLLT